MNVIESERIVNLSDYECKITEARNQISALKRAVTEHDEDKTGYLVGQLDLTLHEMEAFNFILERRTVRIE